MSGPSAILGKQIEAGAGLAAEANGAEIKTVDDACTADGGAAAAREFAAAKVNVVVGFLCTEAIQAALPILKEANIPVITVGVRTESLTDRRAKTGWPVYRLGPRGDDERNAVAAILTRLWQRELFAIVDDGTIYGREIAETLRAAAEQAALKPVFTDTFRPQLDNQIGLIGRLKKAGATHVFAGGDGDDIAIMGRDAGQLEAGITFAGGENLRTPPRRRALRRRHADDRAAGMVPMSPIPRCWPPLPPKTLRRTAIRCRPMPRWRSPRRPRRSPRLRARGWPTRSPGMISTTAIGPLRFDDKGDLSQNLYRAFRFDGTRFVPAETN